MYKEDLMAERTVTVNNGSSNLWWLGVIAGIVTMLFGIAALFWPGLSLVVFVYLFSAYVLLWGIVAIVKGFVGMTAGETMVAITLIRVLYDWCRCVFGTSPTCIVWHINSTNRIHLHYPWSD